LHADVRHDRLERVAVVGTSGAGKTTFARALAEQLGVPHVELDALHWGPHWTPAPADAFRARVDAATAAPRWVCDGNYSAVRDLVWTRATALVWLDYAFPLVFARAVRRTLCRTWTGEELWAGNRESWVHALDSEWIPWWVLRTYRRRRRDWPALLASPEQRHLRVLRLRRPDEADRLLREVEDGRDIERGSAK
jgi:adenylate kinase family enzyme